VRLLRAGRPLALVLAAGALCIPAAAAQVPTPPPRDTAAVGRDTLQRDTLQRDTLQRDTLQRDTAAARDSVPEDTIKAPLARGEVPLLVGIGEGYRWGRDALFSSGAFTVADLLERIPGLTRYRPGWLATTEHISLFGDFSRTRVFYDGIEIDALDPRAGGLLDLSEVQLWTLEEVAVERGADEVRVHLRSWRVDRTAVDTRTDVGTGDVDTNYYRGFLGRRFGHGEAVQLAAQQYGYSSGNELFGGGDQLAVLARVGWAWRRFSVDAFAIRASRNRDALARETADFSIPRLRSQRTDAYVRAAIGDPEHGAWGQLMAASESFVEETPTAGAEDEDTTRTIPQYVAAAGASLGPFRVSGTARARRIAGETRTALSGRAALDTRLLQLSLYTEQRDGDTSSVEEAAARFAPVSWFALSGAVARRHGGRGDPPDVLSARAEAGLRLRDVWVSGGILSADTAAVLPPPVAFDTSYVAVEGARPLGYFGAIRGRVWKDVNVDVWAVHWDELGYYQPQNQVRAELFVRTNWLRRFPSGNFGFLGSIALEYRSHSRFPRATGDEADPIAEDIAPAYRLLHTLIEIRILDGHLFFEQRFQLNPQQRGLVPGFVLPRQLSLYGVRWQFWN
jgi:hypothetical protein